MFLTSTQNSSLDLLELQARATGPHCSSSNFQRSHFWQSMAVWQVSKVGTLFSGNQQEEPTGRFRGFHRSIVRP